MDKFLICKGCNLIYNKPYILSCGDSICLNCLDRAKANTISCCPLCKQEIEGFFINKQIQEMLNHYEENKLKSPNNNNNNIIINSSGNDILYCKLHKLKVCNLICKTCTEVVCIDCVGMNLHPKHDISDITFQEFTDLLKVIQDIVDRKNDCLMVKENRLEKSTEKLKYLEEQYQKEEKGIRDFFAELHSNLQMKEFELKRELKSYYDENEENVVKFKSGLGNDIDIIKNTVEMLGTKLNIKNVQPNEVFQSKRFFILDQYYQLLMANINNDSFAFHQPTFTTSQRDKLLNHIESVPTIQSIVQFETYNDNIGVGRGGIPQLPPPIVTSESISTKKSSAIKRFQYIYDNNQENNNSCFTLVGSCAIRREKSEIVLTPRQNNCAGAFWVKDKQDLVNRGGFIVSFGFTLRNSGADGLAFVIQNHSQSALGIGGSGLGYQGIPNSIAVEFDIFSTREFDDPPGHHTSIHSNKTQPNSAHHKYSYGHAKLPSLFNTNNQVNIIYDHKQSNIKVILNNVQYLSINNFSIPSLINLDHNSLAFIGFTAGTGGLSCEHVINYVEFGYAS